MGSGYGSKMAAHFGAARVFSMIVCSHRPERAAFIREHYASAFRTTLPTIPDRWRSRCATATRAGRCARAATFFIFRSRRHRIHPPRCRRRIAANLAAFDVIGAAGTTKVMDAIDTPRPIRFPISSLPIPMGHPGRRGSARRVRRPGARGCFLASTWTSRFERPLRALRSPSAVTFLSFTGLPVG